MRGSKLIRLKQIVDAALTESSKNGFTLVVLNCAKHCYSVNNSLGVYKVHQDTKDQTPPVSTGQPAGGYLLPYLMDTEHVTTFVADIFESMQRLKVTWRNRRRRKEISLPEFIIFLFHHFRWVASSCIVEDAATLWSQQPLAAREHAFDTINTYTVLMNISNDTKDLIEREVSAFYQSPDNSLYMLPSTPQALLESMGVSGSTGSEAVDVAEKNVVVLIARAGARDPSAIPSICRVSAALQYPAATFETLAMDVEMEETVMKDLERFVQRREKYRKIGKAWKRGYLLYGPPGTGKSSLIAAMANYLKFDNYDLELTDLKRNSELKKLLTATANRSVSVVEDIDCNFELRERVSAAKEVQPADKESDHKEASKQLPGSKDQKLFPEIEELIRTTEVTPAEVAEQLVKSDEPDVSLASLITFFHTKRKENEEAKAKKAKEEVAASVAEAIDDTQKGDQNQRRFEILNGNGNETECHGLDNGNALWHYPDFPSTSLLTSTNLEPNSTLKFLNLAENIGRESLDMLGWMAMGKQTKYKVIRINVANQVGLVNFILPKAMSTEL
ncbi:hypothetical protein AgCh_024196 [Apium graveolens]